MLDAHTNGKRLRLHRNSCLMQQRICIARGVTDPKKDRLRRNPLRIIDPQCRKCTRTQLHIRHLRTKAHLCAHAYEIHAQVLHHGAQDVRPNVRLLQIADFLRRTCADKCLDDLPHARIITACRQLAVRKRPRTTLAKLHIRRRIEHPRLPKTRHVSRASVHVLPAFEHKRCKPRTRKYPCSKDPRRTKAHDNRTEYTCAHVRDCQRLIGGRGHDLTVPPKAHEYTALILHRNIQHIDPCDRSPSSAPRIQSLMNNKHPMHSTG